MRPRTSPDRWWAWTAGSCRTSKTDMTDLRTDIKAAIVRALKLPIAPEEIEDAAPLFGAGLGLDSIDALELVLEVVDLQAQIPIGECQQRHQQAELEPGHHSSNESRRFAGGTAAALSTVT